MNFDDLKVVNTKINEFPYEMQISQMWKDITPDMPKGACSNSTMTKFHELEARGWPVESMFPMCCFVEEFRKPDGRWATKEERYHAVLVVKVEDKERALDNRYPWPMELELLPYEWHKRWSWVLKDWEWCEGADRSIG